MIDLAKTSIPIVVLGILFGCSQNPPAESASASTPPPLSEPSTAAPTPAGATASDPAGNAPADAQTENAQGTASTGAGTTPTGAGTGTAGDAPPKDALSDEQIAAITSLANNAEIEQAKLARARSKNDQVLQFAGMMIAHHGEAQRKQDALSIGSADSTLSRTMVVEGSETLKQLKEKTGAEFDRAYMQAQVDGHQKVLKTIEDKLIPNAKREDLKAHLAELRPRVKQHLEQAERALAAMVSRAPTPPVAAH